MGNRRLFDLKNIPGHAWTIVAATLSGILVVLCVAFLMTYRNARSEGCKHKFLGLDVGPERECAPKPPQDQLLKSEHASALISLLDRRWCDASSVRREGSEYQNEASYPIEIAVATTHASGDRNFCRLEVAVNGRPIAHQMDNNPSWHKKCSVAVTVPPGAVYRITADSDTPDKVGNNGDGVIETWYELVGRDQAPRGCFAE